MNFVKRIFSFLKKLFNREDNEKEPKLPEEKIQRQQSSYIDSVKINAVEKKELKKKVETLICFGDGLGIKSKIRF